MLHAIVVLAAEAGGHAHESSKTAFYIGGSLLAVWAVVLSAIGLSRAEFPGNTGGQRAVMGITTVLVAVAMATAIITA
jgi:hypothetical protein